MEMSIPLLLFLDVIKYGSFVEAARHRDMDPSQLSRQIKKLEQQLDTVLINRSTRSLALTEVGEEVYQKASELKVLMGEISRIPTEYQKTLKGRVRISSASFLARHYVHPVILNLQQEHPELNFELVLNDQRLDIIKEEFDLAIRVWQPQDSSLVGQKLADIKPVIVASPSFLQQYSFLNDISQLETLPASCYARKGFVRDELKFLGQDGQIQGQSLNALYRVNDADLIIDAVQAGQAYAVVMDCMVQRQLSRGDLVQLFPDIQLLDEGGIYALYPTRQLSPGAKLFVQELKAYFQAVI